MEMDILDTSLTIFMLIVAWAVPNLEMKILIIVIYAVLISIINI